jgi:hypothetical protein
MTRPVCLDCNATTPVAPEVAEAILLPQSLLSRLDDGAMVRKDHRLGLVRGVIAI